MNMIRTLMAALWHRPFLSLAVTGLLLSGCAPLPTRSPTPAPEQPAKPAAERHPAVQATPLEAPVVREEALPSTPSGSAEPPRTSAAVLALLRQADQRREAGDLPGAQSTLERAVKIEPGNARLWLDLAQLRLAQDQPEQAEQLALRAVEHARDNTILSAAWSLIAKARRAQGDEEGAREAEKRAGSQSAGLIRWRSGT